MWSCTGVFWLLFRAIWSCSSAKSLWYMCCKLKCSGGLLSSWHCSWRPTTFLSYEWRTFPSRILRTPTTICRQSIWQWASLLILWCSRSGLKRPSAHSFQSFTVSWGRARSDMGPLYECPVMCDKRSMVTHIIGKHLAIREALGKACINLIDSDGKIQRAMLENALYVPSFKHDIFSVQAATV